MAFYETQTLPNFSISSLSIKQQQLKIVYASFIFDGSEFKINPMNLNDYGYFQVSPPGGSSISIQFITNYTKVLGTLTFDKTVTVTQPSQNTIIFTLSGLTPLAPYFGTLSLMIE
jgi:hypothetical protein